MRLVVLYATVEGQSRRIAERVADRARALGHEAVLVEAGEAVGDVLAGAGAAILCAPVHGGSYPQPFVDLVRSQAGALGAIPSAMVSVSLGIIAEDPETRAEAEGYPSRLLAPTGWHPTAVHNAAGALRFSEYDFFKRWIMRMIARSQGVDAAHGDREFTDWAALDRFVTEFLTAAAR